MRATSDDRAPDRLTVLLSTGEVSGDMAAVRLARRLREVEPDVELFGLGGARLAAAGVDVERATDHLGAVGVSEGLALVPALARAFLAVRRRVLTHPPDVAVLVGNDVFNTLLARWLRWRRVPTVAFFPPQAWMWGRVAPIIGRSYDLILACLPQEGEVYSRVRRGGRVMFVGHFLADELAVREPAEIIEARTRLSLATRSPVIGLLPGSRAEELDAHLDVLAAAARELGAAYLGAGFVLPIALEAFRPRVQEALARCGLDGRVALVDSGHVAMRAADVILVASGTATLEASLLAVPMVIIRKVSRLSAILARAAVRTRLIDSEIVGLPNLILGRDGVPELRQERLTVENVVRVARTILDEPEQAEAQRGALAEVRQRVAGLGSIERVAEEVLSLAGRPREGR